MQRMQFVQLLSMLIRKGEMNFKWFTTVPTGQKATQCTILFLFLEMKTMISMATAP
jgi:hypothetical protein